ncbi:hypothetical protein ACVITL_005774 [Rhizobium pisi]
MTNRVGMAHGWTVFNSAAYDKEGSKRHLKRQLTLFDEAHLGLRRGQTPAPFKL